MSKVIWALGRLSAAPAIEGRAHVDAHLGDGLRISAMGRQVVGEGIDRAGILALGDEQNAAADEIDEQAHIVVATPQGRLVKGDAGDLGMIGAGPSRRDVVVDDPPQPGVPLVDHPRDNGHRHRLHHGHDQRLEQQRETAVRPRPGDRYLLDPALLTGDPRHPCMQVGFVLKEVQMPPSLFLTVIGRTARNAAFRAGEPAALGEIQVDVQAFVRGVELALCHRPRRLDAQRHSKQVGITHRSTCSRAAWPPVTMAQGRCPRTPGIFNAR